jgi:hypothetical protein
VRIEVDHRDRVLAVRHLRPELRQHDRVISAQHDRDAAVRLLKQRNKLLRDPLQAALGEAGGDLQVAGIRDGDLVEDVEPVLRVVRANHCRDRADRLRGEA